jgi:nucleotide-binding universal stress UspA family protein
MRDILVHDTQFAPWSHATEFAARLAAMLKSALTGLWCIEPARHALMADITGVLAKAPSLPNDELDLSAACGNLFRAWASSLGVTHSDWIACESRPVEALRHVGQWHDLLVLGARNGTPWGGERILAEVLLTSERPCMIVPEARTQAPRLERIAFAWNGSASALRALHSALPLLLRSGRLVVLNGSRQEPVAPRLPAFDIEQFCWRHELHCERIAIDAREGISGGALLSAAMAANVDMLVLGAFGHSRLREWALGGITSHMLAQSPIPLLMRH